MARCSISLDEEEKEEEEKEEGEKRRVEVGKCGGLPISHLCLSLSLVLSIGERS